MQITNNIEEPRFDDLTNTTLILRDKLMDAMTPGYQAEFDPDEAQCVGAFVEDALSEKDAAESGQDLVNLDNQTNNHQER